MRMNTNCALEYGVPALAGGTLRIFPEALLFLDA